MVARNFSDAEPLSVFECLGGSDVLSSASMPRGQTVTIVLCYHSFLFYLHLVASSVL